MSWRPSGGHQRRGDPLLSGVAFAASPCTSECPPSFKVQRPRKTEAFIASERLQIRPLFDTKDLGIDPQLLDDSARDLVFSAVARFVFLQFMQSNSLYGSMELQDVPPEEDPFHEAHFAKQRWRCCRCLTSLSRSCVAPGDFSVSEEGVLDLIQGFANVFNFCKGIMILSAIYLERLLAIGEVRMTRGNWRPLLVIAILLSSKVWEDVHPWNSDFAHYLNRLSGVQYTYDGLYRLESLFLLKLDYDMFVTGEVYARYFFALRDCQVGDPIPPSSPFVLRPRSFSGSLPVGRCKAHGAPWIVVQPCVEEEDYCSGLPDSRDITPTSSIVDPVAISSASCFLPGRGSDTSSFTKMDTERDCLDKRNPYVGSIRHAPCAPAPSRHLVPKTRAPRVFTFDDALEGHRRRSRELMLAMEQNGKTSGLRRVQTFGGFVADMDTEGDQSDLSCRNSRSLSSGEGRLFARELREYLDSKDVMKDDAGSDAKRL